jgi:pimeloyl-ACP methyl ester carboxylesterase
MPPSRITVDDGLSALVTGAGPQTVLWIHGYTFDASVWQPVWAELPGWRHVALDLPGHGRSREIRSAESLTELASTFVEIASGLQARHLVGLSFGGYLALQMAIDHPAAFDTVVLSSPAIGGMPSDAASRARQQELFALHRERGAGPWMTELWMTWPPDIFRGAAQHPQLWAALRAVVDRHSWRELADGRHARLVAPASQLSALRAIRARTLVLVGEEDIGSFQRAAELARVRIPSCEVEYVGDAGHLALLELPNALGARLAAHFHG